LSHFDMVPGRGRQPGCRGRGAGPITGCDRRRAWSARVDDRVARDAQLSIAASDRRCASAATLANDSGAFGTHRARPCRARTDRATRKLALADYWSGPRRYRTPGLAFQIIRGRGMGTVHHRAKQITDREHHPQDTRRRRMGHRAGGRHSARDMVERSSTRPRQMAFA